MAGPAGPWTVLRCARRPLPPHLTRPAGPSALPHSFKAHPCLTAHSLHNRTSRRPQAVVLPPRIAFAMRPTMGEWYYIRWAWGKHGTEGWY